MSQKSMSSVKKFVKYLQILNSFGHKGKKEGYICFENFGKHNSNVRDYVLTLTLSTS